ncbi:hypothetical protein LXL04_021143 [Taraxacum kok-saghyz]
MTSSSGSDLSGSGNSRRPLVCHCLNPKPLMESVSWSDVNPRPRFLNCVDSLIHTHMKYVGVDIVFCRWLPLLIDVDPELPSEHYILWVNNIKSELKAFKDKSFLGKLIKKIDGLEKMNVTLELELLQEREANEARNVKVDEYTNRLVDELRVVRMQLQVTCVVLIMVFGVMVFVYVCPTLVQFGMLGKVKRFWDICARQCIEMMKLVGTDRGNIL